MRATGLKIQILIIIVIGIAQASKRPVYVQVSWPWAIYHGASYYTGSKKPFPEFHYYFQHNIVKALKNTGIIAFPAIYGSASQVAYDVRDMDELNDLLNLEPEIQKQYLTVVPVIHKAVLKQGLLNDKATVEFSLYLHVPDANNQLARKLLDKVILCKGKPSRKRKNVRAESDVSRKIGKKIIAIPDWRHVESKLCAFASEYSGFPSFDSLSFLPEQSLGYFSQSEFISFAPSPAKPSHCGFRVHKESAYLIDNRAKIDKLVFNFNIADEFPSVMYAYIILPNMEIVRIAGSDIHIQQSSDALASDVYSGNRHLIINLPQLEPKSLVTYSIKYNDLAQYDTTRFNLLKKRKWKRPFARDIPINFSCDTIPWQVRILKSGSRRIQAKYQAYKTEATKYRFKDLAISIIRGFASNGLGATNSNFSLFFLEGTPPPFPLGAYDPFPHFEVPLVRIAEEEEWDKLFSNPRDSIYSIIASASSDSDTVKVNEAPDPSLATFRLLKEISADMRYLHMSFDVHRMFPAPPDTTLKRKLGDCKDFSALLISKLKRIGIWGVPALVNTTWENALSLDLPSYNALDHMVVFVPGYGWWIDPTYYPLSPWLVPNHLCRNSALVLYPDTLQIQRIEGNADSVYRREIHYTLAPKQKNLLCDYEEIPSLETGFYWKKHLPDLDSTKLLDYLIPPARYLKRHSYKNEEIVVRNITDEIGRILIKRKFMAINAVSAIGSRKIMNLPEIPVFGFVELVSAKNRKADLRMPLTVWVQVTLKMADNFAAKWHEAGNAFKNNSIVTVREITGKAIKIEIKMPKGILSSKDYIAFKNEMEEYRDLFSAPYIISRRQ